MRLRIPEAQAKRRLSSVLRQAQAGHTILVLRHGRPIAQLGPVMSLPLRLAEAGSTELRQVIVESLLAEALASRNDNLVAEAMRQSIPRSRTQAQAWDTAWGVRLSAIARLAVEIHGSPDAAAKWLLSPVMGLDGHRPIDLIGSGDIAQVEIFLGRLEYGVYT